MADSPRRRHSRPLSYKGRSRSRSQSRSRSRGRSLSRSPSPRPRVQPRGQSQSKSPSPCPRSPSQGRSQSRSLSPRPRSVSRSPHPRSVQRSPRSRPRSRGRSQSRSPSPRRRSFSRSRSRSGSRSRVDVVNPGNTLYVTGLSSRVTGRDLEDHFAREGKVAECRLIVEPRTRISRGFAFITMDTIEDAERCIKYLNHSVLEGRHITVEKSKRKRPRTPTPGNYLGLKNTRDNYRGSHRGGYGREDYGGYRRSPRRSPYRGGRDYSPRRSPYGGRSGRERSRSLPYSPYRSPDRSSHSRRGNAYAR